MATSYNKNTNYAKAIADALKKGIKGRELNSLIKARNAKIKGENMTGVASTSSLLRSSSNNSSRTPAYDSGTNYADQIKQLMSRGNYAQSDLNNLINLRDSKIRGENMTGAKSTADLVREYSRVKPKKASFPTFEKFSSPALKVFEQRVKDKYRPEWQRYTYDPTMTQYGNQAAATGSFMLGSAPNRYRDYTDQLNRGFEENQVSARDALLAQIREDYNRRLYENISSPININDYFGY